MVSWEGSAEGEPGHRQAHSHASHLPSLVTVKRGGGVGGWGGGP
jgi:hypothetical protein